MSYKQGDRVFCNGYPGAIVRHYSGGMWEVRVPGGVVCVGESEFQPIDDKPGDYYVSVIDGGRVGRLVGPFKDDHIAALQMVDKAREKAIEVDAKAVFYAFGTIRVKPEAVDGKPGSLNKILGIA